MKKLVIVFMVCCFLNGCAETGEDKGIVKIGGQSYKGVPVELQLPGDERLSVKADITIDANEPVRVEIRPGRSLPVRLDLQGETSLPVRLEMQPSGGLSVKLDMEGQAGLPVEVKLPEKVLLFAGIGAAAIVVIALAACFAAIEAARSARAACRMVNESRKGERGGTE
jgi:hypothetical protein